MKDCGDRRQAKEAAIRGKLIFIEGLIEELITDFDDGCGKQANGEYKEWAFIERHTVYANDVRRIRRELLKLHNLFMNG